MRATQITLSELFLVAGTRAAAGIGLGMLLADCLSERKRKAVGWTLFLGGALSTIPLGFMIFGGQRPAESEGSGEQTASELPSESSEPMGQRNAFARN